MATLLNVSSLTLNPKEESDFEKFVFERIYEQPLLNAIHRVYTGVTMKEQIVLAGQFGKTGIKDPACARPTSGAALSLTEKFWDPAPYGDTFEHCQAEVNSLFKAYYDKIQSYSDRYDIEGSPEFAFIAARIEESAYRAIFRIAWFGDKDAALAAVGTAGLASAADVKFYNMIDGIWKQVFAAVAATTMQNITLQASVKATFEAMYEAADTRLRTAEDAMFLVSRKIWDRYKKELRAASEAFTVDYTMNGLPSITWDGKTVVNMETVWDLYTPDFIDETGGDILLPDRILFTVKDNIPIGTLNENDFTTLESWYERKDRKNNIAYGSTIDAKLLEEYMAVASYGTLPALPDDSSAPSN